MNGLSELRRLACDQIRRKYPSLPEPAVCAPKYTDRTANGLTRMIVDYVTLSGGWATRVTTTGQMRHGRWIYGTTKQGTADVHAVYRGLHLSIEVKIGKDRQSPYQKKVEAEVNAAGGHYFLAKNFQGFYTWITSLNEETQQ